MANIDIKKMLTEKAPLIDKIIEKYIPRKHTKESLIFTAGKPRYSYSIDAINTAISDPLWEFLGRGGKRWRPTLFMLVAEALGGDVEKIKDFVIIPEVVHNATLLIDDIEDGSTTRRGKPCSHILYGTDVAVNLGSEMYYLPLLPVLKNESNLPSNVLCEVMKIYIQEMINVGLGQGMDIVWHKGMANANEITEGEYLQMCAYKTGTLARMSAKIAAVLANGSSKQIEASGKLAETVGIAFQIQDDILNIVASGVSKSKGGLGEDITEGKRTLMVIHTLQKANEEDKARLLEILDMHTPDQALRNEAIKIMEKHDSVSYARAFAKKLVKESWQEVDEALLPSDAKEKLRAFANFLIERDI
jgi:geranylgeranyl diphosphate synthase, type I